MILESTVLCLALNVYHEARSEPIPAQYAVASVTMNRAGHPRNVCDTVTARKQFSWTTKLLDKQDGQFVLKRQGYPKDEHAWTLAQTIARQALKRRDLDFSQGATHYHATYVSPDWSRSLQRIKRMGTHIFYKAR